jgi:hypothetical protein
VPVPPSALARRQCRRPTGAGGPPSVAGLRRGHGRGCGVIGPCALVTLRAAAPPAAPARSIPVGSRHRGAWIGGGVRGRASCAAMALESRGMGQA